MREIGEEGRGVMLSKNTENLPLLLLNLILN